MALVKSSKRLARKSATAGPSKSARKSSAKLPPKMSKQVKTKPGSQAQKPKAKNPSYTEKQLNLPVLNSIVPANAKTAHRAGGTGKKKNKVFVDDVEQMSTILAIVNAEKEGHIESKVAAERRKEEIRQARQKEAERKEQTRKSKLEKTKQEIKQNGKRREKGSGLDKTRAMKENANGQAKSSDKKPQRKSVSFA